MDKKLNPLTPSQIRDRLEEAVIRDLLGPAGGDTEEVSEPTVRGRYLVGMLAPKNQSRPGQTSLLDEDEDTSATETPLAHDGEDSEDGAAESDLPASVSMLPSAMGLSFSAIGSAQTIRITAGWGNYQRADSHYLEKKDGAPRRVWQRVQISGQSSPIPLQAGPFSWTPDPEFPEVKVRGLIRPANGYWVITVYLVNEQTEPEKLKDTAWLFQPQLTVTAPDNAPVFIKRPVQPLDVTGDGEDLAMQMSYRREVEFAVGHSVAVHAQTAPGDWEHAVRLSTCFIPRYDVAKVTPPAAADIPLLADVVLDMQTLAHTTDFAAALMPLVTAYADWIDRQEAQAIQPPPDLQPYQTAAEGAVAAARAALKRIRAGIDLLVANPRAAEAFRFANRAMWQQRIHSIAVRRTRDGEKTTLAQVDTPANRRWYPFQLAFILLNLPALTDVHHPDRASVPDAPADLLWFPTGGGKTEAYLGLTAYTLGLRRLQGVVGGFDGRSGVAVLMRYTLRLLTLQQFQRATASSAPAKKSGWPPLPKETPAGEPNRSELVCGWGPAVRPTPPRPATRPSNRAGASSAGRETAAARRTSSPTAPGAAVTLGRGVICGWSLTARGAGAP